MIGKDELIAASKYNERRLKAEGGSRKAPADLMDDELGIDMLDLLGIGFDYACPRCPQGAPELMERLHQAYVKGALTMARAMRMEAERDTERRVA